MTDNDMQKARELLSGNAPVFKDPTTPEVVPGLNLDTLLAEAREAMDVAPVKGTDKTLEAPNPHLVNQLVANADELKRISDAAIKEREKITVFLAELIEAHESAPGAIEELTVNGATVFEYKTTTSRILNQKYFKNLFPDITGNEECYTETVTRKRLYK